MLYVSIGSGRRGRADDAAEADGQGRRFCHSRFNFNLRFNNVFPRSLLAILSRRVPRAVKRRVPRRMPRRVRWNTHSGRVV